MPAISTRESSLVRKFYEKQDCCLTEKTGLCRAMNCKCGRSLWREWLETQINMHFEPSDYYSLTICLWKDEFEIYDLLDVDEIKSAKHIIRKINKLKMPDFRGLFFLDIEQLDILSKEGVKSSKWCVHWYALVKSSLSEKDLKRNIYNVFNKGYDSHRAKLNLITKKPYNYTYPIKFVDEHKRKENLGSNGQFPDHKRIVGDWRNVLNSFYSSRNIQDTMFCIGFRRNSGALVPISRSYDSLK